MSSRIHRYYERVLLALAIICMTFAAHAKNPAGVLVTAEPTDISELKLIDIRRIYLGLPVDSLDNHIHPVINKSDIKIYKEFIRTVMRMTEKGYKRKLIKRVFRQGSDKIEELHSHEALVEYLINNPGNISFMSEEQAKKSRGLKVIQLLW